jgi:hypothetical protein
MTPGVSSKDWPLPPGNDNPWTEIG